MRALLKDFSWRLRFARQMCVLIVAVGAIVTFLYIIGLAGSLP